MTPSIVNLELTNRCNLECVFCDHPTLKHVMRKGDMTVALLEKLLSGLKGHRIYELGLVGLGEPMLDKLLPEHLSAINQYRSIFTRISLNSNAVALSEQRIRLVLDSPINLVTFSLNSTNRDSYRKLMKADKFDEAVAKIKRFLFLRREARRADMNVSIQFMSSQYNAEDEMRPLFADHLSDKVIVYNRYVFHKPALADKAEGLVNVNPTDKTDRYPCWSMYSRIYVDIDGNVYPCTIGNDSYRENGELLIGNITQDTIIDIFNNARIARARRDAENDQTPFPECASCTAWQLMPNNFSRVDARWALTAGRDVRRPELDRKD